MFALLNLSYYGSYILFLKDDYRIISAFDLVYYQAPPLFIILDPY